MRRRSSFKSIIVGLTQNHLTRCSCCQRTRPFQRHEHNVHARVRAEGLDEPKANAEPKKCAHVAQRRPRIAAGHESCQHCIQTLEVALQRPAPEAQRKLEVAERVPLLTFDRLNISKGSDQIL